MRRPDSRRHPGPPLVWPARLVAASAALLALACPGDLRQRNLELIAAAEERAEGPPQRGGTLNVGTVYVTLSALSWDPADWNWKLNHDTGMYFEQLMTADLSRSVARGGPYPFHAEAYLPEDAIRGELAESWQWEDEGTLVVHLRRGVRFPGKPGVMAPRELDAEDVVYSFEQLDRSPKKIGGYFDHVERVYARDPHTVVFEMSEYNAEWAYRFGYGYYSAIQPRELGRDGVDVKDWRSATGTGPLQLTGFVAGNSQTYERNPDYWGREVIGGSEVQLPLIDRLVYRTIKDEATYLTALRTAKIDILEVITWINVEPLRRTTPELQWSRRLMTVGTFLALRTDRPPFDDVRVRRAVNLAVDQRELQGLYHGGHAELFAFPMHPVFGDYYQPLEEMPPAVRELFDYRPDEARRLLAEAGHAEGFTFTAQVCACNQPNVNQLQVIADYLSRVGITVEIEPLEYSAFLSAMTTRTHAAGYFNQSGHVNPTTSLRKFTSGQVWNPSQFSDPEFDRGVLEAQRTRDEAERVRLVRELTAHLVEQAPHLWLPTPYVYSAWWPWVRNYAGELRAGAVRPGPIYARIWIDHDLKRAMGFAQGDTGPPPRGSSLAEHEEQVAQMRQERSERSAPAGSED